MVDCGRAPHKGDIVDKIWKKVENSDITAFMEALKVQHSQNPRYFNKILLEIATQIPNLKIITFRRNVLEIVYKSGGFTREGECPKDSALTEEGKLIIGTYQGDRWFNKDVKPYHGQIREYRKNNPKVNKSNKGKERRAES